MKSYKKYMTGLLATAFCWAGAVFAADNPFETAENEIYNGRFTSEKVDLRLEQSENKETGRFFVGDLRINGISHLVLARGANGVLTGTMGEIQNQADGKKEFANGASFRFMFQRQENGKYLLQIGENEASQELEKQTFPKLEEFYRGKDSANGLHLSLYPKAGDNKQYTGTIGFKGISTEIIKATVSAGVLQGEMKFDGKTTNSFIIESNKDGSLVFMTGGYKDNLVVPTVDDPITGNNFTVKLKLDNNKPLDMIWCKPGSFMMGSPANEKGRYDNETQHQVTLTKGFWLGKYEVTQAQYQAIMGTNPSAKDRGIGADYPVNMVTYDNVLEFCQRLTDKERLAGRLSNKYKYTLPTEAQWEYACRAGTASALNNGKELMSETGFCNNLDQVGWFGNQNAGGGNAGGKIHPVEQKKANAWGIYDMHGNVWEWCLGWYEEYPTMAVTDPMGPSMGSSRVQRGGSWYNFPRRCRSAMRGNPLPNTKDYHVGFRIALVPVQ